MVPQGITEPRGHAWCHLHPLAGEIIIPSCRRYVSMSSVPCPVGPGVRLSVLSKVFRKQERYSHGEVAKSQFNQVRASTISDPRWAPVQCLLGGGGGGVGKVWPRRLAHSPCLCKGWFQLLKKVLFQRLPPWVASHKCRQLFSW